MLFVYGEPIVVPRRLDAEESERYRMVVEESLTDLIELGEREFEELYKTGEKHR